MHAKTGFRRSPQALANAPVMSFSIIFSRVAHAPLSVMMTTSCVLVWQRLHAVQVPSGSTLRRVSVAAFSRAAFSARSRR